MKLLQEITQERFEDIFSLPRNETTVGSPTVIGELFIGGVYELRGSIYFAFQDLYSSRYFIATAEVFEDLYKSLDKVKDVFLYVRCEDSSEVEERVGSLELPMSFESFNFNFDELREVCNIIIEYKQNMFE